MFKDIIFSYQEKKYIDIHAYKNTEDYLSNYRKLTPLECVSLEVRIAHDLMTLWTHHIIEDEKPKIKKKKTKIKNKNKKKKRYKQREAFKADFSGDEISLGKNKMNSSEGHIS